PALGDLLHRLNPTQEALLEGPRIKTGQDPRERIFRGDAIGQVQVAGKPIPAIDGKLVNPRQRVGTGKDAADGHENDVDQRVFSSPLHARVGEILDVSLKASRSLTGHEALREKNDELPRSRPVQ